MLAMFTVTNDGDAPENTTAAIGTLRQAIFDANQSPDSDTIDFDPGLNGAIINLTQGNPFDGALQITQSVAIDASMLDEGLTINASMLDPSPGFGDGTTVLRIRPVSEDFDITLTGLTITGGDAAFTDGGGIDFRNGEMDGWLTIRECRGRKGDILVFV